MQGSTAADINQMDGTLSLWCEECGVNNIGECLIHGGNMTRAHDNTPPPKAYLSLPKVLAIKRAKNFDICSLEARKGVFAKKSIKIRTLFGPMEAVIAQTKPHLPHGAMEYTVLGKNGEKSFLDTTDKYKCNWMMFVRPANNYSLQNLAAFENNSQIFFVTCKNIPAGAELRVWYAAAYAKAIGKYCLMPEPSDRINSIKKENIISKTLAGDSKKTEENWNVQFEGSGGKLSCLEKAEENLQQDSEIKDTVEHFPPTEMSNQVIGGATSRDVNNMYTCGACCTSFARPRQLESHVCTLFRDKNDSLAGNPRRRKGKPKKIPGSPPVEMAAKVFMPGFLCLDEFNFNSEDAALQGESNEENNQLTSSTLPEVLLEPPSSDLGAAHGEDVNKVKSKRRPGRPPKKRNIDILLLKEFNKESNFTCSNCGTEFSSKAKFLQHNCHTVSYVCQYEGCSKVFASKFKYHRHKITHEKPNNFECKLCQSKFNRLDHLKNHMLVHDSNRNKYVCDTCGKSYLYKSTLIFHKAKHQADEGSSLSCLVCNEAFPTKEELKKHINVHNRYKRDEKVHSMNCPDCGKPFPSEKDIRRHRVTHTKERPFLCEHCPHTFLRKDHLRRHYSVSHKKELFGLQMNSNSFGCHHCYQVFKKQEFLDYHNKTVHPNGIETAEKKKPKEKPIKNFAKTVSMQALDASSVFQKVSKTVKPVVPSSLIKRKLLLKQRGIVQQENVQSKVVDNLQGGLILQPQQQPSQPILRPQQQSSQQVLKPQQISQPTIEADPYPVSILKVHRPNDQEVLLTHQPASVFYTSQMQAVTSQGPLFDSVGRDVPTTTSKTVPFRVHNQLLSQVQLQAPTRSHMQLENQQLQQQQQDQLQQEQQQQSGQQQHLIQQQLQQQQQHQIHQYSGSNNINNAIQMQFQHLLLPQQFTLQQQQPQQQSLTQPVAHILQGINMSDFQGSNNANILIAIDTQNMVSLQSLNLGKPVQQMVIKDNTLDGKQLMQSLIQVPQQQNSHRLINSNGQILLATLDNRTLPQILNNTSRTSDPKISQVLENESSRMIGQMNSSYIPTSNIIKSLSQNTHIQNDVLVAQSQLQDHSRLSLQPQLQDHSRLSLQPQLQAQLMQQQQTQNLTQQQSSQTLERVDQQELSSFSVTWPDSFDFKPVGEMTISTDNSSSASMDNLGLPPGSCWILQQQPPSTDQQQIQALQVQGQQMQSSPMFTLSTACTISDS